MLNFLTPQSGLVGSGLTIQFGAAPFRGHLRRLGEWPGEVSGAGQSPGARDVNRLGLVALRVPSLHLLRGQPCRAGLRLALTQPPPVN